MQKIKCTIAYDGTAFSGFQIQPNLRTIQGEMEKALKRIHKGEGIRIHPSGRTDAGVHAMAQVIHFETGLDISVEGWKQALHALAPEDIQINEIEKADAHFHARYNAIEKEYRYFVLNSKKPDVFKKKYLYHSPHDYNIDLIKQACKVFEGTHDFTSYSSAKSEVKGSKVRTLSKVHCEKNGDMIKFIIRGDGFLQHMVRIIVGALLKVGERKKTVDDIVSVLEQKDREAAGVTIPPQGLYLWEVKYK